MYYDGDGKVHIVFATPSIECPSSRQNVLRKGLPWRVGSHLQTRLKWLTWQRFTAATIQCSRCVGRQWWRYLTHWKLCFWEVQYPFCPVDSAEMREQFSRHVKYSDISLTISILKMGSMIHDFGYVGATFEYNKPISRYWFYTEGEREKDIEKVYTKSWKQVLQIMSEPLRSNQKHLGYLLILLFHNPTEDEKTWLPGIGAVLGKEIIIISIT